MENFRQLRERAVKAARTAEELYAKHFNRRVCQQPVFCKGGLVNINRRPAVRSLQPGATGKYQSRRLEQKNSGSFPAIRVRDHTLVVHINKISDAVPIHRVALAKANKEASHSGAPTAPADLAKDLNTERCAPWSSRSNPKQRNMRSVS